jgi:hypothetical protein
LYLYSYGDKFKLICVHSEHSLVAGFVCPGWPLFFWKEATVGMPRTLGRLVKLSSTRLVKLSSTREATLGIPRTLGHIARIDRRWFRAHPERRHRCRWPDTVELDFFDCDRDARLVMAVRHLGRGYVVYQPVFFQGGLPRDERSAAALFALAATSSEPIPVIALMDVLRMRRGLHQQTLSQQAFDPDCNESLAAPISGDGA